MTIIELVDLCNEFRGMHRAITRRLEGAVLLGLVSPEYQQITDSQELQINEHVLKILPAIAATHDMRHHGKPVAMLYGSSNGNGTRSPAYTLTLHKPILQIMVYILTTVACDVDVKRIVLPQLFYGTEQVTRTTALQGWQHLKGKCRALMAVYHIRYAHLADSVCRAKTFNGHNAPNWV